MVAHKAAAEERRWYSAEPVVQGRSVDLGELVEGNFL
jgi:hypothetical protein